MNKKKSRGYGFSEAEINDLLETICTILPIGGEEWDMVEHVHTATWPDSNCTKDLLKR